VEPREISFKGAKQATDTPSGVRSTVAHEHLALTRAVTDEKVLEQGPHAFSAAFQTGQLLKGKLAERFEGSLS
jgi:hypothetical protein